MDADLDTLATALYVTIDETLQASPELAPWRPAVGIAPKLTDAELLTLAVLQALLGHVSEARWLRYARKHLRGLFPYLPRQSGYSKRLKAAVPQLRYFIRALAVDTGLWTQTMWVADSTPVECGRSRETVKRSALAGWAGYGYDRSHSRWYWGLKLYVLACPDGMPVAWCLATPKLGEREAAEALLDRAARQHVLRPGLVVLADKGFAGREFDALG